MAKKKMGRPTGVVHDKQVQMRLSSDFLAMLDDWRAKQPGTPSRTAAIRDLVTRAIAGENKKNRK
jgi:hypothetical protein